ncbi:MAG TPA: hypothetical protein ENJ43_05090 [Gammaproteobacteria bacterium]|nr:hypothetical protein [Gammaproteobacteria bacterium]
MLLATLSAATLLALLLLVRELRNKQVHLWLGSYLKRSARPEHEGVTHIMFCFVDHYEPRWENPPYQREVERVARWLRDYPKLAEKHSDADGRHPRHSFFYPEEEYREEHLDAIAQLCRMGYGEIEIHLHHHDDTETGLRDKLQRFTRVLHEKHGALSTFPDNGQPAWGFIHGNWALDNSLPDGSNCGVNNELIVLREMGCYADFTLPSAPSSTQTSKINSIYYAKDDPEAPKSHDDGRDVRVGGKPWGDLMIIQGPLMLNWRNRKWGILPRIENGDIRTCYPPTPERVDLWVKAGIHVRGRPEWLFIKVHTHGTQERDMECLLGEPVDEMFSYLEQRYNDGEHYRLHYVSAREMYNIIKAAEAGMAGDPSDYRDFILQPPANCAAR